MFCGELQSGVKDQTDSLICSILRVPALGTHLKQDIIPLLHTPRGFIVHPENKHFYIIESDHRVTDAEPPTAKMEDQVSWGHDFVDIYFKILYITGANRHLQGPRRLVAILHSCDRLRPGTKKFPSFQKLKLFWLI